LWGIGAGNLQSAIGTYTTHSFYLTILAGYGIIGAVLIGIFVWPLVRQSTKTILFSKRLSPDLGFALAVFVLLAFQVTYDSLFSELLWLPFSILYVWALRREQKQPRQVGRDKHDR
jgi:O-antigen ligase